MKQKRHSVEQIIAVLKQAELGACVGDIVRVPMIDMIEGNSVGSEEVAKVDELVGDAETVLVILDSNHSRDRVLAELEAYHHLVTPGSYIVATDGVMKWVYDGPRREPEWKEDNPSTAAHEFVAAHPEFSIEQPEWPFNESDLGTNITHWPDAWIKRSNST